VVALDDRRRAVHAAALDDVRVQRPLHEVLGVGEPPVFSSKIRTNSSPIVLRFSSGSTTPRALEEPVAGVDVDELDAHVARNVSTTP
jgi:hypothetical protein